MLSLSITNQKELTKLLFAGNAFDNFLLHDAVFTTAVTTTVSGIYNPEFFEENEEKPEDHCIDWEQFRPIAMDLIRGKKLPVAFRIVLITSKKSTAAIVQRAQFSGCEVSSLSVNFSFRDKALSLTTGVAYGGFSLDKSLEKYWDEAVLKFLDSKEITYEIQ
ncbi:MAG: hypothetical protein IKI54_05095 [Lachnospiraceae bacterium]|nr:hypothetical protein [Lachnospiraceae bacterium]